MSKIVLCGGGTAGHVMPNIALLPHLKKHFDEIHYIGTNGIEKQLLADYKYVNFHEIECVKLIRSLTPKNLLIPFKLIGSINKCKKLLNNIKPNVIFSKGGYVSVPVVLASKNIPVIAHESDYTMGLANKIIYKKAKTMFFSFEDACKKYKKGVLSGPPIRQQIFNGNKIKAKSNLYINNNLPCILVVGGSLGAKAINDIIYNCLPELTKIFNIIHITGKNYKKIEYKNYYQIEYAKDIEDYLSLSDIVISRAGSNAIFEFLALKKPMLLIPLPKANSRGDQILNAKYFQKNNWANVIFQENINKDLLINTINQMYTNLNKIRNNLQAINITNGTERILTEILKYKNL